MRRQKNSPGQGSYTLIASLPSEAMYYSQRKTKDVPQLEAWQEERGKMMKGGTVAARDVMMAAVGG